MSMFLVFLALLLSGLLGKFLVLCAVWGKVPGEEGRSGLGEVERGGGEGEVLVTVIQGRREEKEEEGCRLVMDSSLYM